jgi:hypothetical protein
LIGAYCDMNHRVETARCIGKREPKKQPFNLREEQSTGIIIIIISSISISGARIVSLFLFFIFVLDSPCFS